MAETQKKVFDLQVAGQRIKNVTQTLKELKDGFDRDIIPHHLLGGLALPVAIWFYRSHGALYRYFPIGSRVAALSIIPIIYLGWGQYRVNLRKKFLKNLTETFENAGLRTASGRMPSFISDREIDNNCRLMVLNSNKVPLSTFTTSKEKLESGFFGYIDQIKEERATGVIRIYYSEDDFPEVIDLDTPYGLRNYSFTVGNTRSGKKIVNLIDVPHLLVAGSSNSGKSTFLKQFIATLYLNNPSCEFVMIDLKFGLESLQFKNLPRIEIYTTPPDALEILAEIQDDLKMRGELLAKNNCKNIAEYNKKITAPDRKPEEPSEILKRKVIIIDEAAQLFLAGPEMDSTSVAKARGIVSTIAAQGRALGINIVVSTQRPDINIIDGSIKANLQGRVCFHMSDNATSMTILDSVRAADLPDIKGRAIWRNGPELLEVQVPQIEDEKLAEIFKPMRVTPPPPQPKKSNSQTTDEIELAPSDNKGLS